MKATDCAISLSARRRNATTFKKETHFALLLKRIRDEMTFIWRCSPALTCWLLLIIVTTTVPLCTMFTVMMMKCCCTAGWALTCRQWWRTWWGAGGGGCWCCARRRPRGAPHCPIAAYWGTPGPPWGARAPPRCTPPACEKGGKDE